MKKIIWSDIFIYVLTGPGFSMALCFFRRDQALLLICFIWPLFLLIGPLEEKSYAEETIRITLPNPCVKVEKIEGNKIFTRSSQSPCAQVLHEIRLRRSLFPPDVDKIYIYVDNRLWQIQSIQEQVESKSEIDIDLKKKKKNTYRRLQYKNSRKSTKI